MDIKIKLPREVDYIINILNNNGFEGYAVGGCIRDSILNKEPNDWDITTDAKPEEVIKLFDKVVLTGLKHGTVTVILNKEHFEITTYRTDGEYEDSRHPKEVKFVSSLKEDLARRDFTINAMAYNDQNGLVDYFDGLKDIKNKKIRTVGDPKKRFSEDALRMLRAIRFSAQLDFTIDKNVLDEIKVLKDNVLNISKERIREEFNKLIIANPRKIDTLIECGLFDLIIPSGSKMCKFDQNNQYHIYDLYNHTIIAAEIIEPILHLRLTMILHDLGKLLTRTTDDKGISHFYAHGKVSVEMAQKILKDLKYDNDTINKVVILIQCHDCTLRSKSSIKRMLNKIGENLFRDLIKVKWADILSQNPLYAKERILNLIEIEKRLDLVIQQNECFSLKNLYINGKDLMKLGISNGVKIGETLNYLLDQVIEDPTLNDYDKLLKLAQEKLKQ